MKLNDLTYFHFAEDNKLFINIYSDNDALLLQGDINKMYSWSTNLLSRFHPDKCYAMNIRSKSKQQPSQLQNE